MNNLGGPLHVEIQLRCPLAFSVSHSSERPTAAPACDDEVSKKRSNCATRARCASIAHSDMQVRVAMSSEAELLARKKLTAESSHTLYCERYSL